MRKGYKGALMLSAVLVMTLFSTQKIQAADLSPQKNIIQVNGRAKVKVKPNIARISAGVTTENKDAKKAQAENAKIVDQVKKEIMSQYKLDPEAITTISYTVRPTYDYIEGKQVFRNYVVDHILEITLEEIEKAGEMVDTLVSSGASSVDSVRFGVKDETQTYHIALQKALQDAQQKADALTTMLGVNKAVPIAITEQSESQGIMQESNMLMADSQSAPNKVSTSIEQSDIEVVARVLVTLQW